MNNDFYLVCSEAPLFSPRKCRIRRRLFSQHGVGHALVELDPPLLGNVMGIGDDITHLVMEPHGPLSMFLPRFLWRWPFEVHYSGIRISEIPWIGYFNSGTTIGGNIGLLYPSETEALDKAWNTMVAEDGGTIQLIMDRSDILEIKTSYRTFKIERMDSIEKVPFDKRRKNLLKRITHEFPNSYLRFVRDPVSDGLKGNWISADGFWQIPTGVDVEELYSWLAEGCWFLYVPRGGTVALNNEDLQSLELCVHVKIMKDLKTILLLSSSVGNKEWTISTDWRIRYKEIFDESPKHLDYLSL
ncbi:MAG: hypothetical protein NTY09_07895 [bacterium]|nr:hypothetical protein [bacterium]